MEANKADFAIRFMARRLGVSTSGFYEWRHRQAGPSPRTVADEWLTGLITEIWRQSRGTYGSPRVWAELRIGLDIKVSRKRVERLMRRAGLQGAYRPRRRLRKRLAGTEVSEDLVRRRFNADGPDRLWVADITEHPTRDGKVYLAAVVDAWSRRVVGWSIADHLRSELALDVTPMRWRSRRLHRRPPRQLQHPSSWPAHHHPPLDRGVATTS